MIKFEELIKSLILPLVAYPEDVEIIKANDDEENLEYQVKVNPADFGRVIGKDGYVARAIRTILYAGASKEGKRIHLDINSK
ncbi:MAG: KH domain-containing protein [Anaeroplasmataceae bacterium]|nr:KH domain-containing protein [Anaeroplasmataceae bacterium]MDE6656561.1 KH domain-containing protein [Anaeroplasmataceae bacterium]